MQQLYSRIADILRIDSSSGQTSMLVLASPGLTVDKSINQSTPQGRKRISDLFDVVVAPSWTYKATSRKVSEVYKDILQSHEPALIVLNATQRQQLLDAQKIIYKDPDHADYSPKYKRYQTARSALTKASAAVEQYQGDHPGTSIPPELTNRLNQARDDYNLIGDKNKIIAAKAVIDNLENLDGNTWWGKLQEQYQNNTFPVSTSDVPIYELGIEYKSIFDDSQSWSTNTITDQELNTQSSSSHTSVGGGLGGGWGLFSFGGSYGHSETATHLSIDAKDLSIKLDLLRVGLDRPWMNGNVFTSHAWRFQPNASLEKVSDGANIGGGATPKGSMPFLPTEVIFARNVTLTGNWNTDIKNTFEQQTTTSVRAGWGPFSGNYSRTDSSSSADEDVKVTANSITFKAPQIIGYIVDELPDSPSPKPGLRFPSEAALNIDGLRVEGPIAAEVGAALARENRFLSRTNSLVE